MGPCILVIQLTKTHLNTSCRQSLTIFFNPFEHVIETKCETFKLTNQQITAFPHRTEGVTFSKPQMYTHILADEYQIFNSSHYKNVIYSEPLKGHGDGKTIFHCFCVL